MEPGTELDFVSIRVRLTLKLNLTLDNEAKITKLEKVALEVELKEIESALDELLRRKSSIVEKQKAAETKAASIEEEQTILKLNVATQVNESEAKIVRIQNEIKTGKMRSEGPKKPSERGDFGARSAP